MRKYSTIFISSIVALIFICCSSKENKQDIDNFQKNQPTYILNDSLSSEDYARFSGYVPKDGLVPTMGMATEIAEIILKKLYGNEEIEKQKPFSINIENDIWIIEGSLEKGSEGGVAYIEISKKNGKVLKVTHTL